MNSEKAINILSELIKEAEHLQEAHNIKLESSEFKSWYRDSEVAIENIFGKEERHIVDFRRVDYSSMCYGPEYTPIEEEVDFQNGMNNAIAVLNSFIKEINNYWKDDETILSESEINTISQIELIINRFHKVARQLLKRYSNRETIDIKDEYDVQDLFHGLLKLYFDDVRPEEYSPSYAGGASRVDFLLKDEKIIIEIKKTRRGLGSKEVGEQLIIDSLRYQAHPDCKQLVCFVYDPEGIINNPAGIENDLTQELHNVPISVYIRPKI